MDGRLQEQDRTELLRLGAATVHEAQGQIGAMDSAIRPIDPSMRIVGTALPVDTRPDDNLMLHYALTKAEPGDVLVVDAKGFVEAGAWGDILAAAAQSAGVAGLIIDGAVRDADAMTEMNFPVFARALCMKGTAKAQKGRVGEPIVCAGVRVERGDIVLGDRDGVVVIPKGTLPRALEASRAREAKENELRAQIKAGRTTVDLLGLEPTLREMGLS